MPEPEAFQNLEEPERHAIISEAARTTGNYFAGYWDSQKQPGRTFIIFEGRYEFNSRFGIAYSSVESADDLLTRLKTATDLFKTLDEMGVANYS